MASGLAGKVRRATESDEFDLANYDQAKCEEFAKSAFSDPFELQNMIRLSFVVGGGKLVRQKYSDELPKLFMSAMSAAGFEDDSAAACEAHYGGKYKFQHDTGKNLKFVHVFPRIKAPQGQGQGGEEAAEEADEKPPTHEEILFRSDKEQFAMILEKHLATYGQKKNLLHALKSRIAKLEAIEGKMARLEQLDEQEQAMFDDVGVEELREKAKSVSAELQKLVDEGQLTKREQTVLLVQFEEKHAALVAELSKAEAEAKPKKVQALKQQQEILEKNLAAVKSSSSAGLPPLKHAREIKDLNGKLAAILRVERASKGNYSMDELKRIGEKPEIEEAMSVYSERSRGWFEDDDVFQERLQACLKAGAKAGDAPKKPSASSSKPSASSSGGFTTVSGGGAKAAKAKAAAPSTRNAFSALNR